MDRPNGLLSAGADASEKTIDAAIKGGALLETKLAAKRTADEEAENKAEAERKAPVADPKPPETPPA